MRKKQWIWLIVAVAVFALTGAASVAVNTWSQRSTMAMAESMMESLYTGGENPAVLPDEDFIARVDIVGTIMEDNASGVVAAATGFDYDGTIEYINALIDSPSNKGILLYVDSGGGEVKASDDIYLKLMDYKAITGRPIYAYFEGMACSGAYYIAMAADTIWANRNCWCVNIGVYVDSYNFAGLFEKYGVEEVLVKAPENKAIGAYGVPWTDEQIAIYQDMVDLIYAQFVDVVAAGRGMTPDVVRAKNDGRAMLSIQALESGFIDGICRYEEFADYLLNETGTAIYEPVYEQSLFEQLLTGIYGTVSSLAPRSDVSAIRELVDAKNEIVVMAYAGY